MRHSSQRQSFLFAAVNPFPQRPGVISGRFENGHSGICKSRNRLNSWSRDRGVKPLCVRNIDQPASFVVAEDQRIKVLRAGSVSANNKFLSSINAHLAPGARTLARLVWAVATFRNQTFQALLTNGVNEIG